METKEEFGKAVKKNSGKREAGFSWRRSGNEGSGARVSRDGNFTGPKANYFQIQVQFQFIYQNFLNSSTVRSSFTGQFCFVNCIIFKIIETLILNANMANIKQFFGSEKLRDFRETGPRRSVIVCCKFLTETGSFQKPAKNNWAILPRQKRGRMIAFFSS